MENLDGRERRKGGEREARSAREANYRILRYAHPTLPVHEEQVSEIWLHGCAYAIYTRATSAKRIRTRRAMVLDRQNFEIRRRRFAALFGRKQWHVRVQMDTLGNNESNCTRCSRPRTYPRVKRSDFLRG